MISHTRQHPYIAGIIRCIQGFVALTVITLSTGSMAYANGGAAPSASQALKSAERLVYKENYALAIEKLETVTSAEPNNADAWNLLGFALRKSDQLEDAAAAYLQALSIDPEHKGALEYQGELFIRLGDSESAAQNLSKLQTLCPTGCEELELLQKALRAN